MPTYDLNAGESRDIPGPVNKIQCLSGEAIVIDPTTSPATTHALTADETYDAGGKGGLTINGIDGPRVYVEFTLSPNAPVNGDQTQVVIGRDMQPERDGFESPNSETDLHGEPLDVPPTTATNPIGTKVPSPEENPEAHPALEPEVRGDNDPGDDKQTGSYESRSKASLYELAKERDLDVTSKSSKTELIDALHGE